MKSSALVLAVALSAPQITHAQGTTYVSNLGFTSSGSSPVGSDSWLAADFLTGTNTGGCLLDSVQLALGDASGNPSGFTAMLYTSYITASVPKSSLGTLNGSLNPVAAGVYTFTPASTLTLSPRLFYDIVLTAETPIAVGVYQWSFATTSACNPIDYWLAGGPVLTSGSGSPAWTPSGAIAAQFAINATAVPEPSALGLLALGGFLVAWRHRKS